MTEAPNAQYIKMIETPVTRLVVTLGIPTTISMLVTSIYNMADTAFVGTLGTSASGAVGVVFGYMAILQAIGFMFGQGSGSLIARLLGQQDRKSASRIASTGFSPRSGWACWWLWEAGSGWTGCCVFWAARRRSSPMRGITAGISCSARPSSQAASC